MEHSIARLVFLSVIAAGFATPRTGSAQVLFNNPPAFDDGWADISAQSWANDFSVASPSSMTSFTWWSMKGNNYPPSITASFNWAIYANNAGNPGTAILSGSVTGAVAPRVFDGALDTYEFTVSTGTLSLDAASTYWLGILNYSDNVGGNTYWPTPLTASGNGQRRIVSGWTEAPADGALCISGANEACSTVELESATPEPASLILLATGLIGVGAVARRRQRAI